jgi:hypothetical protein
MFDDLAMDEADDSFDEYDEADSYDEADDGFDEGDDGFDEADVDAGDEYDESPLGFEANEEGDDLFDERDDGFDEEAFDELIAQALGAEDADEFFGKIARGLRGAFNAVRKAAPTIGKIARTVAPIASLIPGVGTAIGGVANVVGKLMADEASEDEALDAFAELAVRNPAARPVLAGLAARKVLGARAPQMSLAQRRKAVRVIRAATNALVRTGGPAAVRALPRIARSVKRTSVARRTPAIARPRVLANAARRAISRNPQLKRQLTRPSAIGRRVLSRIGGYGGGRAGGGGGGYGVDPSRIGYYGGGYGIGQPRGGHHGGWGGYSHYPFGGGSGGHDSDHRRIRTRGPVVISIRPR